MISNLSRTCLLAFTAWFVSVDICLSDELDSQNVTELEVQEERIVVVGSRIRRASTEDVSGVQTLDSRTLSGSGLDSLGDVLRRLPSAGSPLSHQNNNSGNLGIPPDGGGVGAGETHADLRHLGSKRVLVLVDGKRWINSSSGSGVSNSVNLNSIPMAMVDHVDVYTNGASAIYGSDALAGVINVVTRDEFDGTELKLFHSSLAGEGDTYSASLTHGFSGSGWSIVSGLSYFDQKEIGSAYHEISKYPKPKTANRHGSTYTPQGRIVFTDPNTGTQINCARDTSSGPTIYDAASPCSESDSYHPWSNADRFNYSSFNLVQTPSERLGVFGTLVIHRDINTYLKLKYVFNRRESANQAAPEPLWTGQSGQSGRLLDDIVLHESNPFNPFGFTVGAEDVFLTRRPLESGVRRFTQIVKTSYLAADLISNFYLFDRELDSNFGVVFAQNVANQYKSGSHNAYRILLALGDIDNCQSPCVPLNFLGGVGTIDQAMLDWITFVQHDTSDQSFVDLAYHISGDFFELPTGSVSFAAGFESRRYEGSYTPDPVVSRGHTAGTPAQPTSGRYGVRELYLELDVPLLSSASRLGKVRSTVAIRGFDYTTFNAGSTAQIGLTWRTPAEGLSFQFNSSEGNRAPSIGELFGGETDYNAVIVDPCSNLLETNPSQSVIDNCIAHGVPADGSYVSHGSQGFIQVGGNALLTPETADSWSLRVDYRPGWALDTSWSDSISMHVQVYGHEIDDAITPYDSQFLLDSCYQDGIAHFCTLIHRGIQGDLASIRNILFNVGSVETDGYEFFLQYASPSFAFGSLAVDFQLARLTSYAERLKNAADEVLIVHELLGRAANDTGKPETKSSLSATWQYRNVAVTWRSRYISELMESCADFLSGTPDGFTALGLCSHPNTQSPNLSENLLPSTTYHSVQTTIDEPFGMDDVRLVVGINNVLDENPPISYSATINGYVPSVYEIPGSRSSFVQLSYQW